MNSLSLDTIFEINPYVVCFDRDGKIAAAGPYAVLMGFDPSDGSKRLLDLITIERPIFEDLQDLLTHLRQMFVFRFARSPVPMRGQIVPDGDNFVLVSNPWITTEEEFSALPAELTSRAYHEPWSDYFTMSQIFRHQSAELEKMVARLSRSEAHLRGIINAVLDAIVIIDTEGTVIEVNPAFEKMFGISASEIRGTNISVIVPEPHRSQHDRYLKNYLETGIAHIIGTGRDLAAVRKDGSMLPVHIAISEAAGLGSRYYVGILQDITERKQVEKIKDEFLSTVSHELKTPLTSVLSTYEILEDMISAEHFPEAGKWIALGKRNAMRLKELITGVLSAEKLRSGQFIITGQTVTSGSLLQRFMETHADFLGTMPTGLVAHDMEAKPEVIADPEAFNLVVINLVRNAARHSQSKQPIEIGVAGSTDAEVTFYVRDHGIGIPLEHMEAIFRPFYRIEGVDSRRSSGTGLGLSIVKSVIERMSGRIWVDSKPGQGCTFWFTLPAPNDGSDPL